jgi:hypothetical protein
LIQKSLKEEEELDLVDKIKNKITNYGLIKIWIKVKFLMEMILHMAMVLWQVQGLLSLILKGWKFGGWEVKIISKINNSIGKKEWRKS